MRLSLFFILVLATASAQTKKIDFFGTIFHVNNTCVVKEGSIKYEKNALIWSDAPPAMMHGILLSTIKNKLKGKQVKEVKSEPLKLTLFKKSWEGKHTQYKKDGNDTITNFVQLYGEYKEDDRLLILMYKTPKPEPFRIPAYFDFLVH